MKSSVFFVPPLQEHTQYKFDLYLISSHRYFSPCLPQIFNSNPRYILFIHLVINDTMQLVLSTLLHVVIYTQRTINTSMCLLLLVVTIITTHNTPLNLASIAAERYVAVCLPLRHAQLCTVRKTHWLIGLMWAFSSLATLPDVIIILITEPPAFYRTPVKCSRETVFRNTYSLKKRAASHIFLLVVVWLVLFYTYVRMLHAAKTANKAADNKKARDTVVLHGIQLLLGMLVYVRPMFESALLYMLPNKRSDIGFTSYIFSNVMPRLFSPLVYGLRDATFRRYMTRYLLCKMTVKT